VPTEQSEGASNLQTVLAGSPPAANSEDDLASDESRVTEANGDLQKGGDFVGKFGD